MKICLFVNSYNEKIESKSAWFDLPVSKDRLSEELFDGKEVGEFSIIDSEVPFHISKDKDSLDYINKVAEFYEKYKDHPLINKVETLVVCGAYDSHEAAFESLKKNK